MTDRSPPAAVAGLRPWQRAALVLAAGAFGGLLLAYTLYPQRMTWFVEDFIYSLNEPEVVTPPDVLPEPLPLPEPEQPSAGEPSPPFEAPVLEPEVVVSDPGPWSTSADVLATWVVPFAAAWGTIVTTILALLKYRSQSVRAQVELEKARLEVELLRSEISRTAIGG